MDSNDSLNTNSIISITPVWSIIVIVVLASMLIVFIFIFVRRFRKRYHIHAKNVEKKPSVESLETLVTGQQQQKHQQEQQLSKTPNFETMPSVIEDEKPNHPSLNTSISATPSKQDFPQKQDDEDGPAPEPLQEIRISLPLPPPSSSFFSDKMELEDGSSDLYDMYVNSKKTGKKRQSAHYSNSGFISIDLDTFSNAAANIHRKASTMKKSLYQSVRKPTSAGAIKPVLAQQIFTEDSKHELTEESPLSSLRQVAFDLSKSNCSPEVTSTTSDSRNDIDDILSENEEPALAAKRIIRSASRKARARSMVLNPDQPEVMPKQDAQKFATVRTSRVPTNTEHVTISSGSVRRFVRQSILVPDESFPTNLSEEAALPATLSRAKRQSNANVMDISKWWDGSKTENSKAAPETRVEGIKNSDSSYSIAPQYRASLNNSIFSIHGTLSKSGGSAIFQEKGGNKEDAVKVSRKDSTRRGTLGKNTLKTLTASATHGVNKSLRGLFDQSSSLTNINKVVPSDSQKMELDSEQLQESPAISVHHRSNSRRMNQLPQSTLDYSSKYSISSEKKKQSLDESSQKVEADGLIMKQSISLSSEGLNDAVALTDAAYEEDREFKSSRKVLQNIQIDGSCTKENEFASSFAFDSDSIESGSIQQVGITKQSSRRQSLLTKSLLSQQAKRTTQLMCSTNTLSEDAVIPQQAPEPVASFSSSTVRTVIPDNEIESYPMTQKSTNRLSTGLNGSNKILASSFGDEPSILSERFSSKHNTESNDNAHSRRSSGGASTATAVRLSGGYPSSTWNGRKNGTSRLSVIQVMGEQKGAQTLTSEDKPGFFSTMRKDKKTRGGIPWMASGAEMTPAQIERDKYLKGST
ncbi:hypothetical protein G6F60_001832 [Rhizopus arrhizus]|nr:hypothetical protein G6F61_001312 [Rhizopus arrhizus]KAG1407920.1 hypothetical protein G6F60_001832 [Rhizopus arrhizus]